LGTKAIPEWFVDAQDKPTLLPSDDNRPVIGPEDNIVIEKCIVCGEKTGKLCGDETDTCKG
jgi:hypothetical protein